MKPFKLEIVINDLTFSKTFEYDFSFIDFVKKIWVGNKDDVEPQTIDECKAYIRKFTAYKIVDFEKEAELFDKISRALNSGLDNKKMIELHLRDHNTLQQKFTGLCLAWVETVGSPNYYFDGRNEYSHRQCKKIVDFMSDNCITSNLPLI